MIREIYKCNGRFYHMINGHNTKCDKTIKVSTHIESETQCKVFVNIIMIYVTSNPDAETRVARDSD